MMTVFRISSEVIKKGCIPCIMEVNKEWIEAIKKVKRHYAVKKISDTIYIIANILIVYTPEETGWKLYSQNGYAEGEYKDGKYSISKNDCFQLRNERTPIAKIDGIDACYDSVSRLVFFEVMNSSCVTEDLKRYLRSRIIITDDRIDLNNIIRSHMLSKVYSPIVYGGF